MRNLGRQRGSIRWLGAARRALAGGAVVLLVLVAAVALLLPPAAEADGRLAVVPAAGRDEPPPASGPRGAPASPAGSIGAAVPPGLIGLGAWPWGAASALSAASPAARGPLAQSRCGAPGFAGKVNLNQAGERELDLLPGIGPMKARRIIEWRSRHGRFRRIKDLRRVKGFGRRTVLKLFPYLTLDGPTTATAEIRKAR
jgi:competence protein ComEA